jgi:stage V sporulation protein B
MMQKDKHRNSEGYNEIMSALILTIIPVLLSTTVYNISSIIDQGIFKNFALYQGHDANAISESWGVFTGQYKVLINVPLAIASAMAASTVPSLTAAFHSNDDALVKKQINMANRFVMVIAFPCCVGMMVLASPIMQLLFNDTEKSSGLMLMIGGCSIIFYSLSTLSNGILQGLDKMTIPVKNALIALVAHVAFLFLLMEVFDLHIYAVIIANAFYALLMCFLNQSAVLKYSGARIDIKKVFLAPLEASALMGVIVYLVYRLLYGLVSLNASSNVANFVACVVSIIAGVIVYFVSMLLFKGVDEETLMKFPGGTKLCSIAYSLHLLR